MDEIFKALADITRRSILDLLFDNGGLTLNEIWHNFEKDMSRQAVMKHLAILENSQLVVVVWDGREKRHYLNPAPIHEIQNRWVKKFQKPRIELLNALKMALEAENGEPAKGEKRGTKKNK